MSLLQGKKALIFGIANDKSIAWSIAQAFKEQGAELAITYAGEAFEKRVRPLAESLNATLILPCNVTSDEEIKAVFNEVSKVWDGVDIIIHAIAFANKEELKGTVINTTREGFATAMDISVCREVLETLLTYDIGDAARWQRLLDRLPPHLIDTHGELKEWARADLEENYDHRHSSHLYGAYPGHEFQPELNPGLSQAARIANRMRAFGNESFHGIGHRAQAAARLKDPWLWEQMLRLTLEGGYVSDNFTTVHNPYFDWAMPDAQGALPTIVLESLFYSRPGFLEPLPALPGTLPRGSVRGMKARSFATVDELRWNLEEGWIVLQLTSLVDQELTVCCRRDFEEFFCEGAEWHPGGGTAHRQVTFKAGTPATLMWKGVS